MLTIKLIIVLFLICLFGYFLGLRRGNITHMNDYENGYQDGMDDALKLPDDIRYNKARSLIQQLDELFDGPDDEDIIDGGEY